MNDDWEFGNDSVMDDDTIRGKPFEDLEGAKGSEVFYRPDRYGPAEFGIMDVVLSMEDSTGNIVKCTLVNVSQTGMAFVPPRDMNCRLGDFLSHVKLSFDDDTVYDGRILIRTVRTVKNNVIAGAEFLDSLLGIDDVLRMRDLKKSHQDSILTISSPEFGKDGDLDFKGLVAEFSLFLRASKLHFNKLEKGLAWEDVHGREESLIRRKLIKIIDEDFGESFARWVEEINCYYVHLDRSRAEALKGFSRALLHPLILNAPYVRRAYEKPLGYAGDYAVMNYMYDENRIEGNTLFDKAVHRSIHKLAMTKAVKGRKNRLKKCIIEKINECSREPFRCVSIASGPAAELYDALLDLPPDIPPLEFILFDQEQNALRYAYTRLLKLIRSRFSGSVRIIPLHDAINNLLLGESVLSDRGPFDLCLVSGLTDYLNQALGKQLTSGLFTLLSEGGECWIGNLAPENPGRWAMEHILEWHIIHRTTDELSDLASDLPDNSHNKIIEDDSGLIPFLKITRS